MGASTRGLPMLSGDLFLTDTGIETTLIFLDGFDLPAFAAFVLLDDEQGRARLQRYFSEHSAVAQRAGTGFVFESPTWRSNPDWGAEVGYEPAALDRVNRDAIRLLTEARDDARIPRERTAISGCIGPRSDGYHPANIMSPDEAQRYHDVQISTFADTNADLVTAVTMTNVPEAIGIVRAASAHDIPAVISFTLETDGVLPCGDALGDAITAVDDATDGGAAYFMVNCAHPTHFANVLDADAPWATRLRGVRANASRRSHAELDEATDLDDGNPTELAKEYADLRARMPSLNVFGGCCGTDLRHIEQVGAALTA
jgi:S-methylmethionine-dependent homocysteine/selenocysteine methylase